MENESARESSSQMTTMKEAGQSIAAFEKFFKRNQVFVFKHNGDLSKVDRIFKTIGQYLHCLVISDFNSDDANDNLQLRDAVQNNCVKLKVITFRRSTVRQSWMNFLASSETLEAVNFEYAICANDTFPIMKKLEQLTFRDCTQWKMDMINSALRNTNICFLQLEILQSSMDYDFLPLQNLRLLHLLIHRCTDALALDSVLHLKKLLFLKITAKYETINLDDFFNKMAKHDLLEELLICNVYISRETFIALSLMKLTKLHIACPLYFHSPLNVHEICQTMAETMPNLDYVTLSINHNLEKLPVEDIILLVERLKYLEVLDLSAVESNFYYPECQTPSIPIIIASINEALKTSFPPNLKLFLPWDLLADFFYADGQIKEEYRPLISSKVQFMKRDGESTRFDDNSASDISDSTSDASRETSDESSSEAL